LEKYNVIIETPAISDIDGIFDYIANVLKEPRIAERICCSIESAVFSLRKSPLWYSVIEWEPFFSKEIRKMPAENYLIFFTVDKELHEVHVLRVMYNRRNWQNLL